MTVRDAKRPPIHPVYAAAFEEMKNGPSMDELSIPEIRNLRNNRIKQLGIPLKEVIAKDLTIESNGKSVELHVIRPVGSENETLPAIIYLHGGGWVLGSKHTHAKIIRDLCVKAHVVVVFVEYSLSPEVKFPVALEECYAALVWLRDNGGSINVNADQIAVGGDSAGGNMSTALSILAKERELGDVIKTQILIYPACAASHAGFESYELFGNGDYPLSKENLQKFGGAYFPAPALELNNKLATPLLATKDELQGLPPALVFTAECDILRDEGEEYARRLTDAGVPTTAVRVIGTVHGYISLVLTETPQYRYTISSIAQHLKDTFGLQ